MLLYQLTDEHGRTPNGRKWGMYTEHIADEAGGECSDGLLFAYADPMLALLCNPLRGACQRPVLWEADGDVCAIDCGLRVECTRLTTIRKIPIVDVTPEHRAGFAILCASQVFYGRRWSRWAEAWLQGQDRSQEAAIEIAQTASEHAAKTACAMACAMYSAAEAHARAGTVYAATSAYEAAGAAHAAGAKDADTTLHVTYRTVYAAMAAARAAKYNTISIDFVGMARAACQHSKL
jgi:hypothetical protein